MAKEILMPKMGMTMESGTVVQWLVEEGAAVEKGDVLLTVETDKATLDVEAFDSGTLLKIFTKEGETVPVLQPIGVIGKPGEQVAETAGKKDLPKAKDDGTEAAANGTAPTEGTEMPESKMQEKEKDGRQGIKSTPLAKRIAKEKGILLERIPANSKGIITEKEVLAFNDTGDAKEKRVKTTPVAARMAEDGGIDPGSIEKDGRIYKQDVAEMLNRKEALPSLRDDRGRRNI